MPRSEASSPGKISLVAATALGVGGMMGAGLYTLLGLAATSAGSYLPVAFALAAAVAAFSVYSYARLGATFPSRGGAANFIIEEFGQGTIAGGINVFQYFGYLMATALYAAGFATYAGALAGGLPSWAVKVIGVGIVALFTVINVVNSRLVGRAQTVIVGVELVILVGFVVLGLFRADPSRLTSGGGSGVFGIVTAAALLYVTYQGFGVIANTADRMPNPRSQLPRAMFAALGVVTVLYVVISAIVVAVLPGPAIIADAGHVLADAGQAVAGRAGFVVIAVAALLATSSAVNATLFASANIGFQESESAQLPGILKRTIGRDGTLALVVSAGIIALLVIFFPLNAVGQMTSLAFLLVYGVVSLGHLRVRGRTGARAWPLVAAVVVNAALFLALLGDAVRAGSAGTWITLLAALVVSFAGEAIARR
jgi:amino acid transporter